MVEEKLNQRSLEVVNLNVRINFLQMFPRVQESIGYIFPKYKLNWIDLHRNVRIYSISNEFEALGSSPKPSLERTIRIVRSKHRLTVIYAIRLFRLCTTKSCILMFSKRTHCYGIYRMVLHLYKCFQLRVAHRVSIGARFVKRNRMFRKRIEVRLGR